MDYPKSVPNIGLVDGHFVDENPVTGQIGSLIPAAWGDAITQEVLNVIKGAGLVPDEANVSQLLSAVLTIAASDFKKSVRIATTGPIALSGLQTVDGTVLVAGDRVLVKNQANAAQNWIYIVAAGAWVRAQDANESAECTPGHLVSVQTGTVNAGSIWQLSNTSPPVLGTTALNFVLALGKTGVAAGSYNQVVVDVFGRITSGSNPSTLAGHGITDSYTKTQEDNLLADKASLDSPALTGTPTGPTAEKGTNTLQLATTAFVQALATALVGGAAGNLNTLGKLAAAIGNDPTFFGTMADALAGKAAKATTLGGYGITDAYTKTVLDGALAKKASLGTPLSAEVNLNTLGKPADEGDYFQELHVNATVEKGYPIPVAGNLAISRASYGCSQEYTSITQRKFLRSCIGPFNGDGPWSAWAELQTSADVGFTYVYPNGGSAPAVATVSTNSRYVVANPFGSAPVICIPQILVGGVWETIAVTSPGIGSDATVGLHAAGRGSEIIVRTGTGALATSSAAAGMGSYPTQPPSNIMSAQCRVQVWRIKG